MASNTCSNSCWTATPLGSFPLYITARHRPQSHPSAPRRPLLAVSIRPRTHARFSTHLGLFHVFGREAGGVKHGLRRTLALFLGQRSGVPVHHHALVASFACSSQRQRWQRWRRQGKPRQVIQPFSLLLSFQGFVLVPRYYVPGTRYYHTYERCGIRYSVFNIHIQDNGFPES